MTKAEEVLKAFADYELSRYRLGMFTSRFYRVGDKEKCEEGIDYRKFHYIMTFAREERRITPAQKRELELIANRLEEIKEMDFSVPVKVLREFLKEVKVKTRGNKGK
ncbi:hypothetical protein HG1285_15396 [Hydrogenivirga sp. 128-5-R1-1]|nr:hypothetical protein HG1285_15396 [Hydrogenivirga sp. 128-5-R1-1]